MMRSSNRNNNDTSQEEEQQQEERRMNDTTMPPPRRPAAAAGTTTTTTTTNINTTGASSSTGRSAAAAIPRKNKKVPPPPPPRPKKGFGLSDWNRLLRSSNDLALRNGQPLRQNMKWKEIRKHNKIHDGWIVLNCKQVYFISPYLAYHPGGSTILKQVLGKDATQLYNKYHRWVNADNLIGKLLIGYVDPNDRDDDSDDSDDDVDGSSYLPSNNNQQQQPISTTDTTTTTTTDGFPVPAPRRPK